MRRLVSWFALAFVFMIPWEGVIRFAGFGTAAKLTGLAAGVCWLILIVLTGRVRTPDVFVAVTTAFVVWVGASVWWSTDTVASTGHLLTWLQSLALVVIIWDVFRTRAAIMNALQAFVLGAYVAVGGAVINYLSDRAFYTNYNRFSPGDTNPDGFGFVIALAVPVAWYLAAQTRGGRFPAVWRIVNLGFVPIAFLGLALSGTRTAAVAAVVGTAFGIVSLTRLRPLARIAAVLTLAIGALWLAPIVAPLPSFQRLGTTAAEVTQGDLNGRFLQWSEGFASFERHPLFGVGANRYRSVSTLGKEAHNSFISVLVELGLVGLVLFLAILAIAIRRAVATRGWDRGFWVTVLVVWTIGSSTLTWEHRKTTWLFLSLIAAAGAEARQRAPATVSSASPRVVARTAPRLRPVPSPGVAASRTV